MEPGLNPGLPRSGKRERNPPGTVEATRRPEALALMAGKRWIVGGGLGYRARESEDLPAFA